MCVCVCVDFQNQSKVNSEKKHCEPVGLVVGNTLIAVFFFLPLLVHTIVWQQCREAIYGTGCETKYFFKCT